MYKKQGQITGNTDYYGKYILNEKVFTYTVKHWVGEESRDVDTVSVIVGLSGTEADIKDIILKQYSGYKYDSNDKQLKPVSYTHLLEGCRRYVCRNDAAP